MSEIKLNLFVNHYQCGNAARQKELDFCLSHNYESGLFDQIINFNGRITYDDFFTECANYPEDINILTNSDIYFNETINLVKDMKDNECFCITRWEEDGDEIVRFKNKHTYNREAKERFSQDVWVIKGKARAMNGNFHLGVPGCDNRICYEFTMAKYAVSNPCEKIQCIHKHNDMNRSYIIPKGYLGKIPKPYRFIDPDDEMNHLITRRRRAIR